MMTDTCWGTSLDRVRVCSWAGQSEHLHPNFLRAAVLDIASGFHDIWKVNFKF